MNETESVHPLKKCVTSPSCRVKSERSAHSDRIVQVIHAFWQRTRGEGDTQA